MSDPAARRALERPIRKVVVSPVQKVGTKKKVFVIPGTVHLGYPEPAKTVQWVNETGGTVSIWLANLRDVLSPLNGEDLSRPIDIADGDHFEVGVKDTNSVFLRDYPIYCNVISDYADGDSSPHMGSP